MRILALVPGGISDQLLFFPALEDIKRAYPNAEIAVAVEPKATAAYRVSKTVDNVIPFAFSSANSPSDWANLLGILRDREYEVAITTDLRWRMGFMLWLSGIPTRITFNNTNARWCYTATVADPALANGQLPYQADRYHDLLRVINIEKDAPELTINLPEADLNWANSLRKKLKLDGGYVLMYPGPDTGSADVRSLYPLTSWQKIIADFSAKQPEMPIVLLQTEGSKAQTSALKRENSNLTVAATENLGQTAAIIAGANLLITPDSYVMQLATALKVFTLALFGKNSPKEMLPPVEGDETRFLGITSDTGYVASIDADTVLKKVWDG